MSPRPWRPRIPWRLRYNQGKAAKIATPLVSPVKAPKAAAKPGKDCGPRRQGAKPEKTEKPRKPNWCVTAHHARRQYVRIAGLKSAFLASRLPPRRANCCEREALLVALKDARTPRGSRCHREGQDRAASQGRKIIPLAMASWQGGCGLFYFSGIPAVTGL